MSRDFEDFEDLVFETSEDDVIAMFDESLRSNGIEPDDHTASVPLDKLPYVITAFSSRYTLSTLRKYHDWINGENKQ